MEPISDEALDKQIEVLLKFVNSLPIPDRDGKLKLVKKILDEQYTTVKEEAYNPENEEKKEELKEEEKKE